MCSPARSCPDPAPAVPSPPAAPILFDLDGCIVDSLPSIIRCWQETLPQFGLTAPDPAEIRRHVGPPVDVAAASFAPDADAAQRAAIVAAYRRRSVAAEDTEAFTGMPELLSSLAAAGRTLGIATSKSIEVVMPLLERLELTELFTVIEGTPVDEIGTDKTTVVGRAIAALAPRRPAMLIGDRRHDVVGAHAHGLQAIGVLWGYGGEAELRDAGADAVVASPAELAGLINRASRDGSRLG